MGEAITKYPEKRIHDGTVDLMIDLFISAYNLSFGLIQKTFRITYKGKGTHSK